MPQQRSPGYFPLFLCAVAALFIGLLVYTYRGAEQANPVILDEHGNPRGASSQHR